MNAPKLAALAASSRSASVNTTKGALPPSSSSAGLRWRPATSAIARPTWLDPVKLIRRTLGWAIRDSVTAAASSRAHDTMFKTPGGNPASSKISPSKYCACGAVSEALRTTALPQTNGTAIDRTARITGAFHGAIARITPTGWRTAIERQPGTSEGIVSPIAEYASAAASRNIPAASMQLKSPHGFGEPISVATIPESVWARAARRSAALARTARRCAGLAAAHAGNAAAAASTAARASLGLAAGTSQSFLPLKGSNLSKVHPPSAVIHLPPMNKFSFFIESAPYEMRLHIIDYR